MKGVLILEKCPDGSGHLPFMTSIAFPRSGRSVCIQYLKKNRDKRTFKDYSQAVKCIANIMGLKVVNVVKMMKKTSGIVSRKRIFFWWLSKNLDIASDSTKGLINKFELVYISELTLLFDVSEENCSTTKNQYA
ncbi:hypothetical protein [Bacillus sp. FJAT-27445]|uniref:hypothetical protein n=1 Tax=Bacillus sp. FJAT-27445 TaxID=1679166 RepID=UPI000743FE64|nr:hypothetical protein [Bacillus sp. FJAT-27445]